jgi:hypothetical protein
MSLGRLNFDQIAAPDLQSLIDTGVPEGLAIEYKAGLYGRNDAGVKEFLKDVSSFANTAGGHLIIGMDESDGFAVRIVPLTELNPDEEVLRLENLLRDGVEPRLSGARIRAVPIGTTGFVIVIRVPRSWNPPHRVSARNTNRFYIRNSAGSHEVSVEELRVLFNVSATVHDRIRAFRQERLAKISAGETPVALANELGKTVLHIVPFSAFSGREQVDLVRAYEQHGLLRPISAMGFTPRFNFDGFINFRGGEECYGYTQLFRNGCIEATKVRLLMENLGRVVIPTLDFDNHILEVLPLYLDALRALDVPPPLVVMLTLEGVYGSVLGVGHDLLPFDRPPPISQSVLELPEIVIEDYGSPEDYQKVVRPAFDALWNAGGFPASAYFDENDVWTGPRRR